MRPLREVVGKARLGDELPQSVSLWRGLTLGAATVGEPGGTLHSLHLDEEQAASLATGQGKGLINGAAPPCCATCPYGSIVAWGRGSHPQ